MVCSVRVAKNLFICETAPLRNCKEAGKKPCRLKGGPSHGNAIALYTAWIGLDLLFKSSALRRVCELISSE